MSCGGHFAGEIDLSRHCPPSQMRLIVDVRFLAEEPEPTVRTSWPVAKRRLASVV